MASNAASGTYPQNTSRQLAKFVTTPPMTKPLAPAAAPAALHIAIAARRWGPLAVIRGGALQAARRRQHGYRMCSSSHYRGQSEDHQANQNDPAVPEAITQPGTEQEQSTEAHRIPGRNQAASFRRGVQVRQHGRQGGDHHRDAENVHELNQAQRDHSQPHPARLPSHSPEPTHSP